MLSIDGAQKSGSGTILRHAVALAALVGCPVRVPRDTEHLDSNLWLVGQFGARASVERKHVAIEGLALSAFPMAQAMG